MKTNGGVEVYCHLSLPRHNMENSGQFHGAAALLPGKEHPVPTWQQPGRAPQPVRTLWRREKSYPCRETYPGSPARSLSIYQLSYPGSEAKGGTKKKETASTESKAFFITGFLHGLLLDPKDGNSAFVRNVSELLPDYTALHLRRQYSS
jgi:hypothetical protein